MGEMTFQRGLESQEGFGQGNVVGDRVSSHGKSLSKSPEPGKLESVCPGSGMEFTLALQVARQVGKKVVSRPTLKGACRSWALADPCERLSGSPLSKGDPRAEAGLREGGRNAIFV